MFEVVKKSSKERLIEALYYTNDPEWINKLLQNEELLNSLQGLISVDLVKKYDKRVIGIITNGEPTIKKYSVQKKMVSH